MPSGTDTHDESRAHDEEPWKQDGHLDDVDDGCCCVKVWEALSDRQADIDGT
jgi:hypothetical protein